MKSLFNFTIVMALLTLSPWATAFSQMVMTPQNVAMGGGGTTYVTGFEANFINPANLMIRERSTNKSVGIGILGGSFNPTLSEKSPLDQAQLYLDFWDAYRPGSLQLDGTLRATLLGQNYPNQRTMSEHQHRVDAILGGLKFRTGDHVFSLTARARNATRIEVGRGWYDQRYLQSGTDNGMNTRDMSLVQQSQFLYEFSLGYAQTFDFVNGIIPRLGKLYIGIAPKFIIGGSYMNLEYDARYWFTNEMDLPRFTRSLNYNSSGTYSRASSYYRNTNDAPTAIQNFFPRTHLHDPGAYAEPTGYGGGFDFGMTYVLSLGDDLSLAKANGDDILKKSIRLGFSVTDLGFVAYNQYPLTLNLRQDTVTTEVIGRSETRFAGKPGQYISFLSQAGAPVNPLDQIEENSALNENQTTYSTLLPTSFNAGMLLQLNRMMVSADLSLGLNDTAFNNTKLTAHFGVEVRPLESIPIRLGTQLAAGYPTLWTAGTGLETQRWEFSVGGQFLTKNNSKTPALGGAALGAFTYHF